ncbi:MAG: Uncharacterized protein FD119_1930 [Stygiobacter sp.]|nr:MAG: Uncharacterized protein FD119_1930 [Stygiobacter sp.]
MANIFRFGEAVPGYDVPVLNEREVRAAAGILFFFALVSFMNSWLMGDFQLTQIFVIAFLIDFAIRIFINPSYAPSMILGRFAVRNQAPEYAGAPQKRFAWSIGFALAALMFYLIVLNNMVGPVNLIVCATCLTLMFFETAFGICLACKIYDLAFPNAARHCPGGVCETGERRESQKIGVVQAIVVVVFLGLIGFVGDRFPPPAQAVAAPNDTTCTPPDWAVAMGHGEMWKLHNNCK